VRTQEIKESAQVPSKEGLQVQLEASLLFSLRADRAAEVYRTVGPDFLDVIVIPQLRSTIRGVTSSYEAKALYTSEREVISSEINKLLSPLLESRGIVMEKVLLRSITLPPVLSAAIEKKLESEQQFEQMRFVLEKEKREAERKRIEARGIADFQQIVSQGINENLLRWKGIEATKELAASPNSKVVVVGSGKDGLPIILGDK
jgi:regulator of protease activity HflC (stomatin/prohibitin superfamily)